MNRNKIGILGAIGYDDFGDDALLLCNIEELLKRDYNIVVFSNNIPKTTNLLISHGFLPLNACSDRVEIVNDLNAYVNQKNWLRYLNILINFGNDEIITIYYQFLHYKLCRSQNTNSSSDPALFNFIKNVKKCSLILNMGGGYMNYYHRSKIYSYIVAQSLAYNMGKKVIAYGQTFGPLSKIQKYLIKRHIQKIHHITVRDKNRSKPRLIELGFPEHRISEGPDDAIFLDYQNKDELTRDFLEQFDGKFIVITNFGMFLQYSKKSMEEIYQILAIFFDFLIEKQNAVILNISMTSSGIDVKQGLSIQQKMKNKKFFFHLPLYTNVNTIKLLISQSDLILSSRLHPIVFAISEKKPYIGISSGGEYYDSKLVGITEIYGYNPTNHVINADNLSHELLTQFYNRALNDCYSDKNDIFDANHAKRKFDLDNIRVIIEGKNPDNIF